MIRAYIIYARCRDLRLLCPKKGKKGSKFAPIKGLTLIRQNPNSVKRQKSAKLANNQRVSHFQKVSKNTTYDPFWVIIRYHNVLFFSELWVLHVYKVGNKQAILPYICVQLRASCILSQMCCDVCLPMMQGRHSNPKGGVAWVLRENYSRIMHLYFCPPHFSGLSPCSNQGQPTLFVLFCVLCVSMLLIMFCFFPFEPILFRSAVVFIHFGIVYRFLYFCSFTRHCLFDLWRGCTLCLKIGFWFSPTLIFRGCQGSGKCKDIMCIFGR